MQKLNIFLSFPGQGLELMTKHHIYMLPSSGRINLGALTSDKLDYVARAIADVVNN